MLTLRLRSLRARLLGLEDADALQELLVKCADYFRGADGRPPGKHAAMERISNALGDEDVRLFGLAPLEERRWCGLLELRIDEPGPREGTIVLLLLEPDARRKGLGREIAESAVEALGKMRVHTVHLGVQDHEDGARAFWDSVGFERQGRAKGVTRYERKILKSS